MNTGSEVQDQAGDDAAEDANDARNSGSRRGLLGGVVGGLALTASGLFLPAWLHEEAEADNAPVRRVQQRKAQKRERRRNQPDGDRNRRRRQDTGRGGDLFRGVQINFFNTTFRSVDVEFWVHEPFIWRKKESTSYTGGSYFFRTDNLEALLWIDGKYCVEMHNYPVGTPDVQLGSGGSVRERGGWHPGRYLLAPTGVAEREDLPPITELGVKFALGRYADSGSYINFKVDMSNA